MKTNCLIAIVLLLLGTVWLQTSQFPSTSNAALDSQKQSSSAKNNGSLGAVLSNDSKGFARPIHHKPFRSQATTALTINSVLNGGISRVTLTILKADNSVTS